MEKRVEQKESWWEETLGVISGLILFVCMWGGIVLIFYFSDNFWHLVRLFMSLLSFLMCITLVGLLIVGRYQLREKEYKEYIEKFDDKRRLDRLYAHPIYQLLNETSLYVFGMLMISGAIIGIIILIVAGIICLLIILFNLPTWVWG